MPLQAFAKFFPNWLMKTGMPTGFWKCNTKLTAYKGTSIPQLGTLDTPITGKDEDTKKVHKMDTTFYVINTPGPAISGLPSTSRLRIVYLNCSVQFRKHGQPIKVSKEREKVKQDVKNLKLINSKDDLIKAYPDRFKGIGKFPGTYHICHTCCAHTQEIPNSHKIPGKQEAGQTIGARDHSPSDRTNELGIITSLLMESRWWPQDLPQPNTSEQSYETGC